MPRQFKRAKPYIMVFCEGESEQAYTDFLKEEFKEVTKTYLYVTVLHKTMGEIVDEYKFNEEQKECLTELLQEKNKSLWKHIILDF